MPASADALASLRPAPLPVAAFLRAPFRADFKIDAVGTASCWTSPACISELKYYKLPLIYMHWSHSRTDASMSSALVYLADKELNFDELATGYEQIPRKNQKISVSAIAQGTH